MNFLLNVIEKIDDSINPIVVKELRQAVKGRFIIGVMMIFLAIQLAAIGFFITDLGDRTDFSMGKNIFMTLYVFLLITCMVAVPGYAGIRLAAERSDNNMDLLFITSLTPGAIVRGKFYAALILALLMYSTSMPFMTFTYFLRGIDLPTIFAFLAMGFLGIALSIHAAIFLACVPASQNFRMLMLPIGGSLLLGHLSMVIQVTEEFLRKGFWGFFSDWESLFGLIVSLLVFFLMVGFWHVLSIALISPPTANRAFPVRLYVTVSWLILLATAIFMSCFRWTGGPVEAWMGFTLFFFWVSFAISVSERESIGPRIASAIPKNILLKWPAFFFFSGGAGGIAWSVAMVALTIFIPWFGDMMGFFPVGYRTRETIQTFIGLSLYFYSYAMSASLLRRCFFSGWFGLENTWVFALVLLSAGSALSPMFGFMIFGSNFEYGYLLNPFLAMNETHMVPVSLFFSLSWAILVTFFSANWFVTQMANFKRPQENGTKEIGVQTS